MPYLGKSPAHGNFQELTDVSGSFNGSTTQFALTDSISSTAITPNVAAAVLISINGVIQEPTTDYTVSGTNITFTSAPASNATFFGIVMGTQLDVGTPSDATVTPAKMNITSALVPATADGAALGSTSAEWSDLFLADGSAIYFGNDQEIFLTHDADTGLTLKHSATADDKPVTLHLKTGETDIAANDVLGKIDFSAPDEGTGTDAILVAAGIAAVSEGDFSSSNNATKLSFKTAASEAAAEKMSLSSAGLLTVTDDVVIKSGGTIGGANDTDLLTLGNGALTVAGTVAGTAITASGVLKTDDTTEATSTTDGSLQTDGGLSVAKDAVFGDDVKLLSDSAVLNFGADSDVTITHAADASLTIAGGTLAQLIMSTGSILPKTDTDTSNTGSVTLNFQTNQNFVLTFTGNVTLANPTTETAGQSGVIVCIQDGTGSRTLSLGTDYETAGGAGITLSTAANSVDVIPYFVKAAGSIQLGAVQKAFS